MSGECIAHDGGLCQAHGTPSGDAAGREPPPSGRPGGGFAGRNAGGVVPGTGWRE